MHTLRPLALILFSLYLVSSVILYFIIENIYAYEAFERIEKTVLLEKAIRSYVSEYQVPVVEGLIEEGLLSKEYFEPKLSSSSYITKHIYANFNQEDSVHDNKVNLRIVSDNPTNLENLANEHEKKILNKFREEGLQTYSQYLEYAGVEYLFYARSVKTNTNECLQCHGKPSDAPKDLLRKYGTQSGFHEKVGDLRAIVALYTPVNYDNKKVWSVFLSINALALIVFISLFFVIYYFTKKIVEKDKLITKQSKFAAMGEMIGMIAHQWRQPLTGIGMTVDNLQLDIELETIDEKEWSKNLSSIKKQIHYLSHTIDDFRNFFKPNQQPQEVRLKKFLEETLLITQTHLEQKGVQLESECDEDITAVTFRNDLMQVILNLVKNSGDAFDGKERKDAMIKVNCVKEGSLIEIEVSDNAGGIAKDIVDKIFDPYFSTKDEKNGTGLGLYMSKMIVEDHLGGKLKLTTDSTGTRFVIIIKDKVQDNGN